MTTEIFRGHGPKSWNMENLRLKSLVQNVVCEFEFELQTAELGAVLATSAYSCSTPMGALHELFAAGFSPK